jgi:hypothetical protein
MIYIWVRTTVEWGDEQAALNQVHSWLVPKIRLWNATFNLSFQQFRHRLTEIAALNHAEVDGAVRAGWDEIPDGALVLSVDDDDWVAPDAARVLQRELDPGVIGYIWTSRWIEVPINLGHRLYLAKRRLLPASKPKWICAANNYAMTKSSETRPLLSSHVKASRWLEPRLKAGDTPLKPLDGGLSVANRTLASISTVRGIESRSQLLRKFRSYRSLYDHPPGPELDWCRPQFQQMSDLMGELEVKEDR